MEFADHALAEQQVLLSQLERAFRVVFDLPFKSSFKTTVGSASSQSHFCESISELISQILRQLIVANPHSGNRRSQQQAVVTSVGLHEAQYFCGSTLV